MCTKVRGRGERVICAHACPSNKRLNYKLRPSLAGTWKGSVAAVKVGGAGVAAVTAVAVTVTVLFVLVAVCSPLLLFAVS